MPDLFATSEHALICIKHSGPVSVWKALLAVGPPLSSSMGMNGQLRFWCRQQLQHCMSTVFALVSHHILVGHQHQLFLHHRTTARYSSFSQFQVVKSPQSAFPLVSKHAGCTHETIDVEAGKTYRLRLIGASGLTYKTVCFEGQLPLCMSVVGWGRHHALLDGSGSISVTLENAACLACFDLLAGKRWWLVYC